MRQGETHLLLDDIFDPSKGWDSSIHQGSLQRKVSDDGSSRYTITVDGIWMVASEVTSWKGGVTVNLPPNRLLVMTVLPGVNVPPLAVLRMGFEARGLPSFGVNDKGMIVLLAAFPISPGFPLDWARKQLMLCMEYVSECACRLMEASEKKSKWDTVDKVLSMVEKFLRVFSKS